MKKLKGKKLYIYYKIVLVIALASTSLLVLTSCKVTEKIQGKWYVEDGAGVASEIKFSENKVTVDDVEYSLKQTTVGTENGIKYYGIEQDGETYSVLFPDKKDTDVAIMLLPDDEDNLLKGKMVYAMNRKKTPSYSEYASKFLK